MYLTVKNIVILTLILISFVALVRVKRSGNEKDGSSAELMRYMRIIPLPSGR